MPDGWPAPRRRTYFRGGAWWPPHWSPATACRYCGLTFASFATSTARREHVLACSRERGPRPTPEERREAERLVAAARSLLGRYYP